MDWRVEEPDNLFPAPRDAALYLAGLGGFWGGIAGGQIAAIAAAPSLVVSIFVISALGCGFLHLNATRKLEGRISGRTVRPWPLGYASFRTQVIATLPSTVMAAAQRLKWHAAVVALAVYSLLVIDFVALIVWGSKR
jgi:hypothetical protein